MVSSPHRNLIIASVLAVGCIVSLFVSQNTSPENNRDQRLGQESFPRELSTSAVLAGSGLRTDSTQDSADDFSLWWKDIDYNKVWYCGRFKCFASSVSNPANGYLLWDSAHAHIQSAIDDYHFATGLESAGRIKQFFSSPPFEMDTPAYFLEHIMSDDIKEKFLRSNRMGIQPSRTVPSGHTMFKCTKKWKLRALEWIVRNGHKGYEETLLKGMDDTILFVKSYPQFHADFQFMIDHEGQVYQLDFDRGSGKAITENQKAANLRCVESAKDYIRKSMRN